MEPIILLVIDRVKMTIVRVKGIKEANKLTFDSDALGEEAIAWALEEHGRCDGNDFTIIPEEWVER